MSKAEKKFVFILVLLVIFSTGGCEKIMEKAVTTQGQQISGAIDVGSDWVEITPPAPLKSTASIQHVSLKMPEAVWRSADWDERDKERKTLKYADGRSGRIEAVLYDDKGEGYELYISGKGGGFDLARKLPARNLNEPPRTEPDFPADRLFTKLKIRSEVPLHLEKIEWVGYDPK
ncbi:MAG: hypothetical protein M3033_14385 [Acidobacteriota bacterium]|nr:hypothetical protein [Acidobacteriota bacterium]